MTGSTPDELGRFAAMAAGWLINLAVAEWFIQRSRRRPRPVATSIGAALPGGKSPS